MIALPGPVAAVAAGDADDGGRVAVGLEEHPNAREDKSRVGCVYAAAGVDSIAGGTLSFHPTGCGLGEAICRNMNLSWSFP